MSSTTSWPILDWIMRFPPLQILASSLEEMLISVVCKGPIPRHIAIVMDGNRRYARKMRMETIEGHSLGFESLKKIVDACMQIGIKELTVFAFSIENFKRSKYEVDMLMDLAKTNFLQFCAHGDLVQRYGIRLRIIGQKDLIRPDIREICERIEKRTENNSNATLNICFPYTSRAEMTAAIKQTVVDVQNGEIALSQVSEDVIEQRMFLHETSTPDILIRTSGVERLSDFLLWQCHQDTLLKFIPCYWPEFNVWKMFPLILEWQIKNRRRKASKKDV